MATLKGITIMYDDGAESVFPCDSQSSVRIDVTYHIKVRGEGDPGFDICSPYKHVEQTGRATVTITACDVLIPEVEGA